jgi:2-dehydro-3-deoxyphosphogluconate aldolase/(4S)-4-hydroxy-2-oxoglutarate aldolase
MNKTFDLEKFEYLPLVGIMRKPPTESLMRITGLYRDCGFGTLELTLNTPGATELIRQMRQSFPEMNIGAGTVCSMPQAEEALSAGATFIVSPILDEQMIRHCRDRGLAVFPGAFSPTEVYRAWEAGATMVKLFPAGQLGPAYVRELLAPLDDIRLMAVGGIHADNCSAYLKAGASGLGMGSGLFPPGLIAQQNWNELGEHLSQLYGILKSHFHSEK